ncbi:hypothetical protein P5673_033228 [Acropora cervicornis]|uniref:Uncharacterized protein n=1 Tax=Acropora cervicornis TaxID=6130 RepID=A0AAD9PQ85_ACRCE|nr:hypothetical protein P5673_033228 [Acropora cervicornis]
MEERREDSFYSGLMREWRSGSLAVITESFKTLPGIVKRVSKPEMAFCKLSLLCLQMSNAQCPQQEA